MIERTVGAGVDLPDSGRIVAPLAGPLIADTVRYVLATGLTLATGYIVGYRAGGGVAGILAASLLVVFVTWAVS